jgi:very-short-patch-repair endonuclease
MSFNSGFIPIPNWFINKTKDLTLTNREFKVYFFIGIEIFRFPETRETLSKELSCRYLELPTKIKYTHIAEILRKLSSLNLIKIKKSYTTGKGSIITLVSPDDDCESYIENKLYNLLLQYFSEYNLNNYYSIIPQFFIPDTPYRVDFVIKNQKNQKIICIIECDGHEFHEKTKEQARKDKKRDRDITKKGYTILHFTGSEIVNNTDSCVFEIIDFIKRGNKK